MYLVVSELYLSFLSDQLDLAHSRATLMSASNEPVKLYHLRLWVRPRATVYRHALKMIYVVSYEERQR